MAIEDPAYRSISQEEFAAKAAADRTFAGLLLPPDLALDELDLTESRFYRCLFQVPIIRSADFSGSEFRDCKFEPARFASCKFAKARFHGCILFDVGKRKDAPSPSAPFRPPRSPSAISRPAHLSVAIFMVSVPWNPASGGAQFHQSTFTKQSPGNPC